MDTISIIARQVFKRFFADAAPGFVRLHMEAAIPAVVRSMEKKGITPESASRKVVVRDALFRLIHVAVPSGDIADLLRDQADDKVLSTVEKTTVPEATLEELVLATLEAYVELVF